MRSHVTDAGTKPTCKQPFVFWVPGYAYHSSPDSYGKLYARGSELGGPGVLYSAEIASKVHRTHSATQAYQNLNLLSCPCVTCGTHSRLPHAATEGVDVHLPHRPFLLPEGEGTIEEGSAKMTIGGEGGGMGAKIGSP